MQTHNNIFRPYATNLDKILKLSICVFQLLEKKKRKKEEEDEEGFIFKQVRHTVNLDSFLPFTNATQDIPSYKKNLILFLFCDELFLSPVFPEQHPEGHPHGPLCEGLSGQPYPRHDLVQWLSNRDITILGWLGRLNPPHSLTTTKVAV